MLTAKLKYFIFSGTFQFFSHFQWVDFNFWASQLQVFHGRWSGYPALVFGTGMCYLTAATIARSICSSLQILNLHDCLGPTVLDQRSGHFLSSSAVVKWLVCMIAWALQFWITVAQIWALPFLLDLFCCCQMACPCCGGTSVTMSCYSNLCKLDHATSSSLIYCRIVWGLLFPWKSCTLGNCCIDTVFVTIWH